MIILSTFCIHLSAGYSRALELENKLKKKWEEEITSTENANLNYYRAKYQKYEESKGVDLSKEWQYIEKEKGQVIRQTDNRSSRRSRKVAVPSPPPSAPNLELSQLWISRLNNKSILESIYLSDYQPGDIGEKSLLSELYNWLSDDYFAIPKLLIDYDLDVDVLLLGPTGIWILESKYCRGTLSIKGGYWDQSKVIDEGIFRSKELSPFDDQWLREKDIISDLLASNSDNKNPNFPKIKGGLVFTHEDLILEDIDGCCKVEFGSTGEWIEKICNSENCPGIGITDIFKYIDMIFEKIPSYSSDSLGYSEDLAEKLYKETESKINYYLKNSYYSYRYGLSTRAP